MTDKRKLIMPIGAALSALTTTLPATDADALAVPDAALTIPGATATTVGANTLVSTGQDLLAFTINERADGSIVAQHHSHASHASHHSHYSSR